VQPRVFHPDCSISKPFEGLQTERTADSGRSCAAAGVATGAFRDIDARLIAHNMVLTAHSWSLKHWNLSTWLTLDEIHRPRTRPAARIGHGQPTDHHDADQTEQHNPPPITTPAT